jgi:hypothetical protein
MRGLFGDFSTMPLKDVVSYLGEKQASGVLSLESGEVRKKVVVREGQVINASSNQPREYLGQFLINLGHITEEQFNRAYETQKETRIFLGKILVMTGSVNEETVRNALSLKMRETLLHAFHWTEGTFGFQVDAVPELPDGMEVGVDLLDIHREGEFRQTAWQAIRGAFPSGEVRLSLNEARLPAPAAPGSLDERLFGLIRDGQTIDDIILALHATDFFLYQRLYALYRLEAVTALEQEAPAEAATPPPIVGSETGPSEVMAHAELFLAQGNAVDAEALARRAHEMIPTQATEALLKKAEAALREQLHRELMVPRPVPTLQVPQARLKTMNLTAPERYLLSRVDGQRDLPSIVQVSPLAELDALKLFQRLAEAGLVQLQPR